MTVSSQYPKVEKLVAAFFKRVERDQGYAFFSDGETFPTTDMLFERMRGRLGYARKVVKHYEEFLKKHGQEI